MHWVTEFNKRLYLDRSLSTEVYVLKINPCCGPCKSFLKASSLDDKRTSEEAVSVAYTSPGMFVGLKWCAFPHRLNASRSPRFWARRKMRDQGPSSPALWEYPEGAHASGAHLGAVQNWGGAGIRIVLASVGVVAQENWHCCPQHRRSWVCFRTTYRECSSIDLNRK